MDRDNGRLASDQSPSVDLGNGSSSPIMKLNEDVLGRIFFQNANMNNDEEFRVYSNDKIKNKNVRALFTTWHSSQVCQAWRIIILGSPMLWAQLIDLDGLSSVNQLMRTEIIQRTGSCSLYVAGHVFANIPREQDFFISILSNDWNRIQSLKVTIGQSNLIPGSIWTILSKSADTMESFTLRASSGIESPDGEGRPISNLFRGYAPSLKSFVSWRINFNFGFGDDLNWLSNIRRLNISYMSSMSLPQWMRALQHMPLLEELQLIYPFPSIVPSVDELKLPQVQLPRLLYIYIIHDLNSCCIFLDCIIPGAGCLLYLDTPDNVDGSPPQSTILLATKVLSRYSQNWLANHPVSALYFAVTHTAITISEHRDPHRHLLPMYRLYICCFDPIHLPLLSPLLDAYASCNLSSIETLQFNVDLFPTQALNIDVFRFILRFSHIKSLVFSNENTINALYRLARESKSVLESSGAATVSLFPHLHTVKIHGANDFPAQISSPKDDPLGLILLQQTLAKFVTWRRAIQAPVAVVDITSLGAAARVETFDGISGLQVIVAMDP